MKSLFESPETESASGAESIGPYRYRLWRAWDDRPRVLWIMLNPSTADALKDDPTIRRCIGFARRWGFGGIEVANLFAWRATDPGVLRKEQAAGSDVVGDLNDATILALAHSSKVIVAGWGSNAAGLGLRDLDVLLLLNRAGRLISCLGRTKSGAPRHPLYVAGETSLKDLR